MKLRTISLLAVAALAVTACVKSGKYIQPEQAEAVDNFYLSYLFTVDGCKVYRFRDRMENRYLTTCLGSVTTKHRVGKNSSLPDTIQTVEGGQ